MKNRVFFLLLLFCTPPSFAQTYVSAEGDLTWQSRNDQAVTGNAGTRFSIADFDKGPIPNYRIYLGHLWNKKHEVRALYAPLSYEVDGRFSSPVNFVNTNFAANADTQAYYKFNSYRLTYAYHLEPKGEWDLAIGFTAKIRDAEVRLTQGPLQRNKTNIGFVPLLHLQAKRKIYDQWFFRFDFDGMAAPQGRAFDLAFFADYKINDQNQFFAGYRTIEGGADNDEVYNFAWIHKAVIGYSRWF